MNRGSKGNRVPWWHTVRTITCGAPGRMTYVGGLFI